MKLCVEALEMRRLPSSIARPLAHRFAEFRALQERAPQNRFIIQDDSSIIRRLEHQNELDNRALSNANRPILQVLRKRSIFSLPRGQQRRYLRSGMFPSPPVAAPIVSDGFEGTLQVPALNPRAGDDPLNFKDGGLYSSFNKYSYGPHPMDSFYLYMPKTIDSKKTLKLAVYAHGGGFDSGEATETINAGIIRLLEDKGNTIVASLNYRLLDDGAWPGPMESLANSMTALNNLLKNSGIPVAETTVIGLSAGAMASARIIYDQNAPSTTLPVNKFVSIGGIFFPPVIPDAKFILSEAMSGAFLGSPKQRAKAFLVGGSMDSIGEDKNKLFPPIPLEINSNSVFLGDYLARNSIPFQMFTFTEPQYNGHLANLSGINNDPSVDRFYNALIG